MDFVIGLAIFIVIVALRCIIYWPRPLPSESRRRAARMAARRRSNQ
jgi:hypothetical protein